MLVVVVAFESSGEAASSLGVPEAKRVPDYLEVASEIGGQKPDDSVRLVKVGGAGDVVLNLLSHGGRECERIVAWCV